MWGAFVFCGTERFAVAPPRQYSRKAELWDRYRLRIEDFEQLRQQCGASLEGLKFVPRERAGSPPEYAVLPKGRPRTRPQTAAGGTSSSTEPIAPAAAAREGGTPRLTDDKIWKLTKGAWKHNYQSHTHRYREDADSRASCEAQRPTPTPEWLQYASGIWARYDGTDT